MRLTTLFVIPAAVLLLAAAVDKPIVFEELGEAAGLRFRHKTRVFPGEHSEVLGMFTAGGSCSAAADFDDDGDDDVFLCNSALGTSNKLLRNDSRQGQLKFVDITDAAGVAGGNDARSVVADAFFFDADDDGRLDLLVARFGTPIVYRNLGQGRFADVSAGTGLDKFGNTIAAIAFDADGDDRLDLLFANYFKPTNLLELPDPQVLPNDLDNAKNGGGVTFWKNVGAPGEKIRFVEKTVEAGFAHHTGWTLDLGHGDLDNDGHQDVYMANDYGTDRIFWNNGDGTFIDGTKDSLGGFDTKKGMNVDLGDFDRDGLLDVYVTNITDEYMKECNMLWHNQGDRVFIDTSKETGTCNTLWGWAAKWGDFDNDGWEDIFVVNGLRSAGPENYIPVLVEMIIKPGVDFTHVASWPKIGNMSWSGFQKKKLFRNLEGQAFKEISAAAGVDNDLDGRGISVADFDNDGRLDLYQANADQDSLFYRNTSPAAGHWVGLELRAKKTNIFAVGARVTLKIGGATLIREVNSGNGYSSQSPYRLHFGLGSADKIDSATIRWPSGLVEAITLPIDRIVKVHEGQEANKGAKVP